MLQLTRRGTSACAMHRPCRAMRAGPSSMPVRQLHATACRRPATRRVLCTAVSDATDAEEAASSYGETELLSTKFELLKKVAALDRGALATGNDRYEVQSLVEVLEESTQPGKIDLPRVQGKWELVYSSVERFRSSPFFWAFQEGLVQNRDIAGEIFKFTDALPGAIVGAAYQTISFDTGKLISEVNLEIFPMIKGTVVTTSSVVSEAPNRLEVTVENTRVSNSNVLPMLDTVSVPVRDIIERIRGPGAARATAEVTFLDDDLRVTRTQPDNNLFIYRRLY